MGVEGYKLTDISKAQASVMLQNLDDRKKKGLASYKQAKLLKKNGMNPDIKFAEARKVIDALAANGWRPTDAIRAMAPLNRETV
jgi:acetyl-CoA acetyltransferase